MAKAGDDTNSSQVFSTDVNPAANPGSVAALLLKWDIPTVQTLGELHALSERLDTAMGRSVPDGPVDLAAYVKAWQAVSKPAEREAQIMLMRRVGDALDAYTRNPFLRHSLRLMRGPARVAGLPELQAFLESGFDTFREMRGAGEFLDIVVQRERAIAASLFSTTPAPAGAVFPQA